MGIPDLTKKTHPKERQAYKKVVLSGGYQIGVDRLFNAFKIDKDLPYEYRRDLTCSQVAAIHAGYRDANMPLQMVWRGLDDAARNAVYYRGARVPVCDGKLEFHWRKDVDILELRLPSGRIIPHYRPGINEDGELTFWRARYGRMMESRSFGGSWLEIACQSTARDILTGVEAAVERELPDVRLILDVYDSVVGLAPKAVAKERMEQILTIMRRVPDWAPGLPLNGEGYVAERMMK
jgi:DNA polymerase bacteriophage-type